MNPANASESLLLPIELEPRLPKGNVARFCRKPLSDQTDITPDAELIAASCGGSAAAFAEIYTRYSHRLFSTIVRITKNHEDAQDVLQDTFMRAHMALNKFEGRSSLYSWLTSIAINNALMVLRKRRHVAAFGDRSLDDNDEQKSFDMESPGPNPEEMFDQQERCYNLCRNVQTLGPALRMAMQMRISDECSTEDIADALQISKAAAKSRVHRARCVLKERGRRRELASHRPWALA